MMKSVVVVSLCVSLFGLVGAVSAFAKNYDVFTSFASKFATQANANIQAVGPTVTTGYVQANSFFNSANCGGEVYAIEYVTLGKCARYTANYTDPNSVPLSCGQYVAASAYTATANGVPVINLNYTFYSDSACTVSPACAQTITINSQCSESTFGNGIVSNVIGFLSTSVDIPSTGYYAMTHLSATCSDTPYSGLWQRTGCTQLSGTDSSNGFCTDNAYIYNQYANSDSCGGPASFAAVTPLRMCDPNVFNGNSPTEVEYGIGYSMSTCSEPPTSDDDNNNNNSDALSDGAIAGIVIGVVVFIVLVAALVYFCVLGGGGGSGSSAAAHQTEMSSHSQPVLKGNARSNV